MNRQMKTDSQRQAFKIEEKICELKDALHKHLLNDPDASHWTCCGTRYAPQQIQAGSQ